MDRIDKFLNRRKQKTKRVVKTNNKYYEITKEDIKIVRKYKKNACLDPTVDMYIPYNLQFSKKTQESPLNFVPTGKFEIDDDKINKKFIKKNEYVKKVPAPKNIIKDLWDDDLEDYEQNLVLDINDQYTGKLGDLRMNKEVLEKELRKTYLRQYLPRETKTLKISDIVKNNYISEDTIYPEKVAKYYKVAGKTVIYGDCLMACYENRNLEVFEIKNFHRIFKRELPGKIFKVKIADTIKIICIVENEGSKIYDLNLEDRSLSLVSEIDGVIDCASDKFNLAITSKSVKLLGTNASLPIPKIDKITSVKTKEDLVFLTTTTSLQIYDLNRKVVINNSKIFSFIIDFTFHENLVFLINNLKKIIIFDYQRNVVIHTMVQDSDVLGISYNAVQSLLAVSTEKEILVFYINIVSNQFGLANRIPGRHSLIHFDSRMPWLYGKLNDKVLLYT